MKVLFPELHLRCLKTAQSHVTTDIMRGKNTIVDFWTTECARCPTVLDNLEEFAKNPRCAHIQFISICCDSLDGAREIIERDDDVKWPNIAHFFIEADNKKKAKEILGFKFVPFCVVTKPNGEIVQMGSHCDIVFDDKSRRMVKNEDGMVKSSLLSSSVFVVKGSLVIEDLDF